MSTMKPSPTIPSQIYPAIFVAFCMIQFFFMFVPKLILAGIGEQQVLDSIDTNDVALNIFGPLAAVALLTAGYFVPKFFKNITDPEKVVSMIFIIKFMILEFVGIIGFILAISSQVYQVVFPYAVVSIVVMMFNYPSKKRRELWLEDAGYEAKEEAKAG
jgi:hypothetical protein